MMSNSPYIFIVEDNRFYANILAEELQAAKFNHVETFKSGEDCLGNLSKNPDIIILDYCLGKINGLDVLKQVKLTHPNIQVIFLSAQEKLDVAIQALKFGAYDYVEKNDNAMKRVKAMIKRIATYNNLLQETNDIKRMKYIMAICAVVGVSILTFLMYR